MKKRRRIFIIYIFVVVFIITSLTTLAKYQLKQFNIAYLNEEIEEIETLGNQIGWAVKPYLEDKNYAELEKYSKTFNNSDTTISIKNSHGVVVAGDKNPADYTSKTEKTFLVDEVVYHIEPILVNNEQYNLLVYTTTKNIYSTIARFNTLILISIIIGCCVIAFIAIYLIKLYQSFNELQNSAVKISAGNMDVDIYIPHGGILYELACALDKMSKRLKAQIDKMKKFEDFRSEFIAGVSHELKTPLTAILSAVETIEDSYADNNYTKCYNIIKKQSTRINSLVQDILSIQELDRRPEEIKINFVEFNLAQVVKEGISLCSVSDTQVNVELENVIVKGDSELLEQAVINILSNAIRYSKSDRIDISLKQVDKNAIISIRDYGIGIPDEHLPHIFEYFYRVDKARSRDMGGTGLGLAIVKKIIMLHNGIIEVKSENGCEFIITLPL